MAEGPRELLLAPSEIVYSSRISRVAVVVGNSCAYGSTRLIIERKFVHELDSKNVRTYEKRSAAPEDQFSGSRRIRLSVGVIPAK